MQNYRFLLIRHPNIRYHVRLISYRQVAATAAAAAAATAASHGNLARDCNFTRVLFTEVMGLARSRGLDA